MVLVDAVVLVFTIIYQKIIPRSIKVGLSPFKKKFFISFNDSPSKMTKNAFYFILKALFVLKIFVLTFWSCRKNSLIRKIRLITKFMTSQPSYCSISHELKATRQ